jgi:hypothetical protein
VSQVLGQSLSPKLKDRGCDNVLPDQDCRTSQWVVIDEYGAMVKRSCKCHRIVYYSVQGCEKDCKQPLHGVEDKVHSQVSLVKIVHGIESAIMSSVSALSWSRYSDRLRTGWPGFNSRQGQDFSLLHNVQTGSGAHPASYPMGAGGSFRGI